MAKDRFYGKALKDYESDNVAHHWLQRAQQMYQRRSFFEQMWRNSLFAFVAFAIYGDEGTRRSFDPDTAPELQSYFNNKFTAFGFRFTDVRYPLEFAVVMRKLAVEIKNLPVPDWMVIGAEDQSPAILWKNVYNQAMDEANGDYEDFETWLQKDIFGTSIRWSRMIGYENVVQEPNITTTGEIEYKEKKYNVREFKSTTVDLRHVLLDDGCRNSDLSDCEDAIVFEYFTKDQGEVIFSDVDFEGLGIKPARKNELFQDINDLNGGDNKEFYEVMNCYHETKDKYVRLMNGKVFDESPIPMRSYRGRKEIPLSLFVDHKIPGQPYGYGEPAVVKAFREIKNKNRNLIYDVTKKAAKPTLAIDPLSTFNEETYTWGQDFVRVAPNDMQPIPVVANLEPALELDNRTDTDIVIATGVNILDTAAPPSDETATKTVIRKESQVALIDLGLHFNSVTGLKRLHRINANILQLNLKVPEFNPDGSTKEFREVITQGKQIFRSQLESTEEQFMEEDNQGVHGFQYKGEDIDFDFHPIIKLGNIAISDQLQKSVEEEAIALMAQVAPQAIDQMGMAEYLRESRGLPEGVVLKQDKESMDISPDSEQDTIDKLIKNAGGYIPEDQKAINNYKNAQGVEAVVDEAQSPAAMGAGGAGAGVPPTGPV